MQNDLTGKKILLIALGGYSSGIVEQMKKMGAEVDYLNDKPNDGVVCKTLGRLKVGFYQKVIHRYYEKALEPLKDRNYDYILVIRGEYTPAESLRLLKKYYPGSRLVLYMWDSMCNNRRIEKKWSLFDKVYTFDRMDYLRHSGEIAFLPLYYYDQYLPEHPAGQDTYDYDVSFIGTGHEDRIRIVKSVGEQCEKLGRKTFLYCYMPHRLIFLLNKLRNPNFKGVSQEDVHFETLPFQQVYDIYSRSRCVMDIESATQSGLTMRSIEMVGLKRKFITTNKDIVNYDFYHPNNIFVADRNNFVIDEEFFRKPYVELDPKIYEKYALSSWILQVLK